MNGGTEVSIKFKNTITGEKKLEEYSKTLQKIQSVLSGMETGKIKQMEQSAKQMGNVSSEASKMAKQVDIAFNFSKIKLFAQALAQVYSSLVRVTQKSSEFLESFNLFQVAFNGNYIEAERFINKLNEMYGLDEAWLTRTVALFKQLSNAMGLSAEAGDKLSSLLTQMSVDISSLYNLDVDKVPAILQSALAGQTKPARRLGADITQATLQQTLGDLGIDRAVVDLSYAEKRLLIVISLTKQLTQATGDWGRTLESPANQMRILSEQFNRLSREVGNLFLPILAKILPYLNAIVMVLTEIISSIARLFGFKVEDYDYFGLLDEEIEDFGAGVDTATGKVEKLKRGLRGFDKLNNITTPSSGGGAGGISGGGGIGGVDADLMKAFNKAYDDYFKKLKNVEMKATKIRDKIMEWLGFQRMIDKETGDVYFKYLGVDKTLSNVVPSLLKITPAIATIFHDPLLANVLDFFVGTGLPKADKLKGLSKETVKNLKPIQDAFNNLKQTISTISFDGLALSDEEKEKIEGSIDTLTKVLKEKLQTYIDEQIAKLNYLYKETGVITEEEYNERLAKLETFQKEETEKIDNQGEELKNTYQNIYDENGNIIMSAYADYLEKLEDYENESYNAFIVGEEDKKKFQKNNLEMSKNDRIKYYSELLKQYADDKNNAIKEAKDKKDKTIKYAEETYGKESEQYDKIVQKANETYKKEKESAQKGYNDIYNEFKKSQTDIAQYIDKDSGKIATKFQQLWNRITSIFKGNIKIRVSYDTDVGGIKGAVAKALGLDGWPRLTFDYYAQGGMPPVGQMFIARESGAELVGNIGSHTAVMNNDQIVSSVSMGVEGAVTRALKNASGGKQIYNIYLDKDHKIGTYTLEQLQDMAKSNGKPLTIGGV